MLQLWGRDGWNGIRTMARQCKQHRLTSPIMGVRTGYWSGWLQVRAPHAMLCSIAQLTLGIRAISDPLFGLDFGP